MKELICVNDYIVNACCGGSRIDFLHGIEIKDGNSILHRFEFPFSFYFQKGKIVITKDGIVTTLYVGDFGESVSTLMDRMRRCALGSFGNYLVKHRVEYIVNNGAVNTFECPLETGETHLDAEHYLVTIDGQEVSQGIEEFQYIVVDGDVFFTEAINDLTIIGQEPKVVTIYYWVTI